MHLQKSVQLLGCISIAGGPFLLHRKHSIANEKRAADNACCRSFSMLFSDFNFQAVVSGGKTAAARLCLDTLAQRGAVVRKMCDIVLRIWRNQMVFQQSVAEFFIFGEPHMPLGVRANIVGKRAIHADKIGAKIIFLQKPHTFVAHRSRIVEI